MTESVQGKIDPKAVDRFVEPIAFIVLFFLIINGGGWLQIYNSTVLKVINDLTLWILVAILFLRIAGQKGVNFIDLLIWKKNWIFLGYIVFVFISLLWSEYFLISFYRVFVLVACSMLAAFIGLNYPISIIFRKLTWFFVIMVALSYFLILFMPDIGTHIGRLYNGAWRGIFFHKNILGIMMSIGSVVFLFDVFTGGKNPITIILKLILYMFSSILVFLSHSAAGILTFFILNLTALIIFAWVKLNKKLQRIHYIIFGIIFVIILILSLSNLDYLLGLVNRNTTFTGRVPLWSFLLKSGLSEHPLLGGGYGNPWASVQFRLAVQNAIKWGFSPNTAHNGYIEIFLHFGLIGIIMLIALLLLCIFRTISYALKGKTMISFFPVLLIIFIITVNLSESFFLEMESFAWFLMVYALFSTTPMQRERQTQFTTN